MPCADAMFARNECSAGASYLNRYYTLPWGRVGVSRLPGNRETYQLRPGTGRLDCVHNLWHTEL